MEGELARPGTLNRSSHESILVVDLSNGKKAGEVLKFNGRSEFELKDGNIYKISDFS